MASKKTAHQRGLQQRKARAAAEAAAARRVELRRRILIGTAVLAVLLVIGIVMVLRGGDKKKTEVAAGATSTTSASGPKACAGLTDPLPTGAPQFTIPAGPPPAELVKQDLKVGTGAEVTPGAQVTAHYVGVSCATGKIFDSSYSRNAPTPFSLTAVIPGWTEGIPGMKVGGQRLLGIPSAKAYGAAGNPPKIAANEPLWFFVEIVDTKPA